MKQKDILSERRMSYTRRGLLCYHHFYTEFEMYLILHTAAAAVAAADAQTVWVAAM